MKNTNIFLSFIMLESAYPFLFIMNLKDEANQDGLLQVKLYRFKSTKSKITYIVRVEKYMYIYIRCKVLS